MKVRYNKIVKEDFVENILGVGKLSGGGYYFQHMHNGKIHYHDLEKYPLIEYVEPEPEVFEELFD